MLEHVSEQDLLLAFDGELPADRNEAVRAHTRHCAACEERWTSLAQLSEQVATVERPEVAFQPQETAVTKFLAAIDKAGRSGKKHWTSRPLVYANALVAMAAAITCIVLLPSLHVAKNTHVSRAAAVYDMDPAVPPGYVSLPFADPALPLDDAAVLPVELSAEDLELMGVETGDVQGDGVQAEILIGMDGWPRAIRIVEQF